MPDTTALQRRLRQISEAIVDGINDGLYLGGEHILGESNAHVPIEEATLERSGEVTLDEQQMVAVVSYDTPYAVAQHEDLTFAHDPGRRAKFLETAFLTERAVVGDIVAEQVRRQLARI